MKEKSMQLMNALHQTRARPGVKRNKSKCKHVVLEVDLRMFVIQ